MSDERAEIFKRAARIMTRLQLLSVFFEEDVIYRIYVRSQVIQRLFETDNDLDISKLDLFHLQYTETVIELLLKIKKGNEKKVVTAQNEIGYNEEIISKVTEMMRSGENFVNARQAQTSLVDLSLNKLYQNLSGYSADPPFGRNATVFSETYAKEFFEEITEEMFYDLTAFDPEEVYKNGYGTIEKKLMGWQCKFDFKNEFVAGLKHNDFFLEVYKVVATADYFIFYPARSLFLDLDYKKIAALDFSTELSKQEKIIFDTSARNAELRNNLDVVKTNIPEEIRSLLEEYHQKISALDFVNDEFDIQANILKTMLNTK